MPSCWMKHTHPSKSERAYCNWLRVREKAREIDSFSLYPSIPLKHLGKIWKADFRVIELDGKISIHESKGWNRSNDSFRLKAHAFLIQYPNVPLFVNRVRIDPKSKRFSIPDVRSKKKKGVPKTFDYESGKWVPLKRKEENARNKTKMHRL